MPKIPTTEQPWWKATKDIHDQCRGYLPLRNGFKPSLVTGRCRCDACLAAKGFVKRQVIADR